jgi:transposase
MNRIDTTRERICDFYLKNCTFGNKTTLQHFTAEGVARSTIYDAIQRVKNKIGPQRQSGQGRTARKMPRKQVKQLQHHFDHQHGRSTRKAARKFNISQSYVRKLLNKCSIKCRKKKTIPDRSEAQATSAKPKCRVLLKKYRDHEWILDDESYFTLSHGTLAGNDIYYSSDPATTPSHVKMSRKKKFEQKLLVWAAISKKGVSAVFTCPSGLAINQVIYREQCLERRLLPFIQKYHSQDEIIFWPDLASSHYAESVCDFMIENKITFVEKYENPANLPECRPIEQFWTILKQMVYADAWQAKTLEELKLRILKCIKRIDTTQFETLFESMLRNLKDVAIKGVVEKR